MSSLDGLLSCSRSRRGHHVDDVRVFPLAEILIRNKVYGRGSRDSGAPLMKTKGSLGWIDSIAVGGNTSDPMLMMLMMLAMLAMFAMFAMSWRFGYASVASGWRRLTRRTLKVGESPG